MFQQNMIKQRECFFFKLMLCGLFPFICSSCPNGVKLRK